MLGDVLLIAGKDLREVLLRQGGGKANLVNWALILFIFGVVIPVRAGMYWIWYPAYVLVWAWLPLLLVSAMVADSFAGERERHTLETLLSTPVSDRAVLFGKILAAVTYALGLLGLLLFTSFLSLNIALGTLLRPFLWSAGTFAGVIGLGVLGTTLIATVGVLVSLGSETVRQASQRLGLGIIAAMALPGLAMGIAFQALSGPEQDALVQWLRNMDGGTAVLFFGALLVMLVGVFVALAMRRFRRSALSLD
jgi:ABC-2 type transport system permease protein